MAEAERKLSNGKSRIDFQIDSSKYRHWKLEVEGEVATLLMDVDEKATLRAIADFANRLLRDHHEGDFARTDAGTARVRSL